MATETIEKEYREYVYLDKIDNMAAQYNQGWRMTDAHREAYETKFLALAKQYIYAITAKILKQKASEDQQQQAMIAALAALRMYDERKLITYKNYAYKYIKQSLYRNKDQTIYIPEYLRCLSLQLQVYEAESEATGNHTGDGQICFALNITPERLALVRQAMGIMIVPNTHDTIFDTIPDRTDDYKKADTKMDITTALAKLSEVDELAAQVVEHHLLKGLGLDATAGLLHVHFSKAKIALDYGSEFLRQELEDYE